MYSFYYNFRGKWFVHNIMYLKLFQHILLPFTILLLKIFDINHHFLKGLTFLKIVCNFSARECNGCFHIASFLPPGLSLWAWSILIFLPHSWATRFVYFNIISHDNQPLFNIRPKFIFHLLIIVRNTMIQIFYIIVCLEAVYFKW